MPEGRPDKSDNRKEENDLREKEVREVAERIRDAGGKERNQRQGLTETDRFPGGDLFFCGERRTGKGTFLLTVWRMSKKGIVFQEMVHNSGIFFRAKDKEGGVFTNSIRV